MNGSHERMHRDMKAELQRTPLWNLKEEQKRFDDWRDEYNTVRPNQALQMKKPAALYVPSQQRLADHCLDYEYPKQFEVRRTDIRGFLYWHQKRRFIAGALEKETIGLKPEEKNLLSVWFCQLKLGTTNLNFDYPLGGNHHGSPYAHRHVNNRNV